MSMQEEEQLLEIANVCGLKSLLAFWIKVTAEYSEIAATALKTLLPFPTSYLCQALDSRLLLCLEETQFLRRSYRFILLYLLATP